MPQKLHLTKKMYIANALQNINCRHIFLVYILYHKYYELKVKLDVDK